MAQIMDARGGMAAASGPAKLIAQLSEDPVDRALGQSRASGRGQERPIRDNGQVTLTDGQIML
jgi:hypothetical protein